MRRTLPQRISTVESRARVAPRRSAVQCYRRLVRGLVVAMLLAAAATAHADTIALVSGDPAFHTALQDAGDQVIVMDEAAPPVNELAASSRTIANRVQADATVWLIAGRETSTLVTYDRNRDRMIVRDLPYTTPLDAARAVETARMVRTMLGSIRFVEPVTTPPPVTVLPPPPPEARFALSIGGGVWL